jgi:hypothetical protein
MVLPLESEGQLHQINAVSLIPDQPIKPAVLHQLATGQTLDTMSLEQPATAHPQLSSLLKSESTTNTLVGGGVGTFTTLMGYQKTSLTAGDTAMLLTNNGITANGENTSPTTTCTSGLADLSWASNDSAVNFCFKLYYFHFFSHLHSGPLRSDLLNKRPIRIRPIQLLSITTSAMVQRRPTTAK